MLPSGSASGQLAQNLQSGEDPLDVMQLLLLELVHLLRVYFHHVHYWQGVRSKKDPFDRIAETLDDLSRQPYHDGTVLIRLKELENGTRNAGDYDYVVRSGNAQIDTASAMALNRRLGSRSLNPIKQLPRAFELLADHGIHTFSLKIPLNGSTDLEHLRLALSIASRYHHALINGSHIVFEKNSKKISLPLVYNNHNQPDPNLTLLAGINDLTPEAVQTLIHELGAWANHLNSSDKKSPPVSNYNAVSGLATLLKKLVIPPVEINNMHQPAAQVQLENGPGQKQPFYRTAADSFHGSAQDAALILKNLYSNDFSKIDSHSFGERLRLATNLLNAISQSPCGQGILDEMLYHIRKRFEEVRNEVFDDVVIDKTGIRICSEGKESFIERVPECLLKLFSLYKGRCATRKKSRIITHWGINFDAKAYQTLARDLGVSVQYTKEIVELVKPCFDDKGHFLKSTFENHIPAFARYKWKIFEFMWHYVKEALHRYDRVAFLNSLHLLVSWMQQTQLALKILMTDFCRDPSTVSLSDRNVFLLANLLVRRFNKELGLDIETTPEEVLLVKEGLDQQAMSAASKMIDGDGERFHSKVKTVRRKLIEAMDDGKFNPDPVSARYLIALEREICIFLSLVEGQTARAVLRSAVQEYGCPASKIYLLKESRPHLAELLKFLKVLIRGLGRTGLKEDVALLEDIRANEEDFIFLAHTAEHYEWVRRIMLWVDVSKKNIIKRVYAYSD